MLNFTKTFNKIYGMKYYDIKYHDDKRHYETESRRASIRKTVSSNIKRLRKSRGLTQLQLAEIADVSVESIGKIETRAQALSETALIKISIALEIYPEELYLSPSSGIKVMEEVLEGLTILEDLVRRILREK